MTEAQPVALIEDDPDLRRSVEQMLRIEGYSVLAFDRTEPALEAITESFGGPVITDVRMPGLSGIDLFHRLTALDAELPVVLITGHGDIDMAVSALKAGAWDFLSKPFEPDALLAALSRAASHRKLILENRRLRSLATDSATASPMIGRSPAMVRIREMAQVLAGTDMDILIEGETGTGKELLARVIHGGAARTGRFVAIACAAMPDALVEEELFSVHGAIAGAQGGTLFLDDIDRASPALQTRLAAFAEKRVLGNGASAVDVNCRIIAAAGETGEALSERLLPALLYRLAGMRLEIPPLRDRSEDVPLLLVHFLAEAAERLKRPVPTITAQTRDALIRNRWPGNVRQLAAAAEQIVLGLVDSEGENGGDTLPDRVAAFERDAIVDAILASESGVAGAIDALGLPRKTFYYKVARHGIDIAALREKGA